jgi:hypothetical protein
MEETPTSSIPPSRHTDPYQTPISTTKKFLDEPVPSATKGVVLTPTGEQTRGHQRLLSWRIYSPTRGSKFEDGLAGREHMDDSPHLHRNENGPRPRQTVHHLQYQTRLAGAMPPDPQFLPVTPIRTTYYPLTDEENLVPQTRTHRQGPGGRAAPSRNSRRMSSGTMLGARRRGASVSTLASTISFPRGPERRLWLSEY